MASYTNARISIPKVFQEKNKIDKEISQLTQVISSPLFCVSQGKWIGFKKLWKDKKQRQSEFRSACEQYFKSRKV